MRLRCVIPLDPQMVARLAGWLHLSRRHALSEWTTTQLRRQNCDLLRSR